MQNKFLALTVLSAFLYGMSVASGLLLMIEIDDQQHLMVKIWIMSGAFLAGMVIDGVRRRVGAS